MKAQFLALALVSGLVGNVARASEVEIHEGRDYKETTAYFGDSEQLLITVRGAEYMGHPKRPHTRVKLNRVNDNLYVVTQEHLAYPAIAEIGAPVKPVKMVDQDILMVTKIGYSSGVTIIAPADLTVSAIGQDQPTKRPPHICMAYWSGYRVENGQCVKRGASGCSNPFQFRTLEACEASLN